MKHIIVGTAGHIDHGKLRGQGPHRHRCKPPRGRKAAASPLISALRACSHPALRLGFVDVPGHERRQNMLAGVGGIDLVLFVIGGRSIGRKHASTRYLPPPRYHAGSSPNPERPRHGDLRGLVRMRSKNWSRDPSWSQLPSSPLVRLPAPGWMPCARNLRASHRRYPRRTPAATSACPSIASSRSKDLVPSPPGRSFPALSRRTTRSNFTPPAAASAYAACRCTAARAIAQSPGSVPR